jgi:serine/threonine-protein kinase
MRTLGRYVTRFEIASGSMGTVHVGQDLELGGTAAIKVLRRRYSSDPKFVETFFDDTRRAACVHHANVIPTLDGGHEGDVLYMVTEYVPGESLARLIYGKPRPAYPLIVAVISDVLLGLQAAHEATDEAGTPLGLVHGDMCPQNILVGTDGVARIFDFGVAEPRPIPTKAKLAYMAPERLEGGAATARTDVYSIGVLLWELITGKRLFKGEETDAVVACIKTGGVPGQMASILAVAASKLAPASMEMLERLDAVVTRAITDDPEERYSSARQMATDLALTLDPASPSDVADWVVATASEVLASRTELIASLTNADDGGFEGNESARLSEPPTLVKDLATPLLPIIVADLADAGELRTITEIAEQEGTVIVPLLTPPQDTGDHVLEVHVPEHEKPTLFLARPAGPPEERGFPLVVRPHGVWREPLPGRVDAKTASVRARVRTRRSLTESHSRDLTFSDPADLVEPNVLGRTLSVQGGRLVLEERLGGGGGGAVYRAKYIDDKRRDVAVKVMHDRAQRSVESCARFHAEALAASKLDHRNLVRVIDFGQEPDGLLHLTMEYLQGQSLRQILENEGPLSMEYAVDLMGQVCAGLAHAHRRGIVHRDVKPSNVILVSQRDDDGAEVEIAKLCDFGIAADPVASEDAGLTTAHVAGTPQYMSPEQCRGVEVDARSDVYSCGVTLYELVTGQLPFEGKDRRDFRRLHELATPTPPRKYLPDIDRGLEEIISKALAKAPANRYQTMLELRGALKKLLEPAFVPDANPSFFPPLRASAAPPAAPSDEEQPIERRLESLVALVKSLTEVAAVPPGRLEQIEKATESLERALRALAAKGDAVALGQVVRVMAPLYEEATRSPSTELWAKHASSCASRLLHSIADPSALVASAQKLLSASTEPTESELTLIVWAKVAGAYALYMARSTAESRAARTRFVSAMRLIGAPGLPVIRGALEQLWPTDADGISQPALVVDLLRSVPGTRDEALGTTISRYARCPEREIQDAALGTLVYVWGERAMPALLAGMQSSDEKVRLTALRGFKVIGGVDELSVRRIDAMLWSAPAVSDDLRAAAAEALAYAASDARPLAARATLRGLTESGPGANNTVAIAFARASLVLAPAEARQAIEARAARGPNALRSALLALF